jgi:hypothetical protein
MAKKKKLILTAKPDRTDAQRRGDLIIWPEVNAGFLVDAYNPLSKGELTDIVASMRDVTERVKSGDLTDVEAMLMSQATALQTLFTFFTYLAKQQTGLPQFQSYMSMGLKSQSQCRTTLQTLLELKFPRTTAFVKQQNIANGPQQVNNGAPTGAANTHTQETETEQSKLSLEDTRHERETLDITGAAAAGGTDKAMETLEPVHRAKKQSRKAQGVKERV